MWSGATLSLPTSGSGSKVRRSSSLFIIRGTGLDLSHTLNKVILILHTLLNSGLRNTHQCLFLCHKLTAGTTRSKHNRSQRGGFKLPLPIWDTETLLHTLQQCGGGAAVPTKLGRNKKCVISQQSSSIRNRLQHRWTHNKLPSHHLILPTKTPREQCPYRESSNFQGLLRHIYDSLFGVCDSQSHNVDLKIKRHLRLESVE